MPQFTQDLTCTTEEKNALFQLSRSCSEDVPLEERARIVFLCLKGIRNDAIAQEISICPNTVVVWRKRFYDKGI